MQLSNSSTTHLINSSLKRKNTGLLSDIKQNKASYVLALPAIIYVFIFAYCSYPYLIMAFQKYQFGKNIFNSEWIGFENFKFFFGSNAALLVTWNTLKLNILFIFFGTLVSIILALALNEMRIKSLLRVNQAIMLFPNYLSWIVVSFMIYGVFSAELGMLNKVLAAFNMEPVNWYANPEPWTEILVIMRVWKSAGINAVIFLAAMTGIDETLYEAAMIDGAGRWVQARKITLPLIMPTILILTLLSIGRIMYGDFGMIYSIVGDNGVLYPTTDVIDTYVFRALRQTGDPAQATAIGLFQSIIGFIMVYGSNLLTKKFFSEGALY